MTRISVVTGDITKMVADAIVNAANTSLFGGGGVDGAIHRAAGRRLLEECRSLNGCKTGEAKITMGYELPAKHVIHAVGPVWRGGSHNEEQLLYSAYHNSLLLATKHNLTSVAFPNISTGIYGFPKLRAGEIALNAVQGFIRHSPGALTKVIFVCYDEENQVTYRNLLNIPGNE